MRRIAAFLTLALASSCAHEHPFRFASDLDTSEKFHYELDVDAFQLQNGLTVVLAPQEGTNLVTVDARYPAGSADEAAGKTGVAHLVEHLTFLGASAPGQPSLEDRLNGAALYHNASTTWDATNYVAIALADHWTDLIDVEGVRMGLDCKTIDPALFERERAVVQQELVQRDTAFADPLLAAIFGADHPYGRTPGGTDLAKLTRDDACAFIDAHYAPTHAILVVSGAFDPAKVRPAIVGRFSHMTRTAVAPVDIAPLVEMPGNTRERLTLNVEHPSLLLAYPAPPFGSNEAIYQIVVQRMIADTLTELDHDRKDVIDTSVIPVGGDRGGALVLELTLADDANADEVGAAVQQKLDGLLKQRSNIYIENMRGYIYASLLGRYEDLTSRGAMIADYLQYTGTAALHLHDLEVARALDDARVRAYADHYIVHAKPKLIHVAPADQHAHAQPIARLGTSTVPDLPASKVAVDVAEADRALDVPPAGAEPFEEITLGNGLHVIFARQPSSSLFEARMVFPVGVADDPAGAPGTAHLAGHQLDVDWSKRRFFSEAFATVDAGFQTGTSRSVSVSEKSTVFSSSGIGSYANWHLWWLHVRLEAGVYDPDEVEAAQKADDDDEDDDARAAHAQIYGRLFGPDHPFARLHKRVRIGADALEDFRWAHYVAGGATLIVSGNFDRVAIEKEIRELWGDWSRRGAPTGTPVPAPTPATGPSIFARDDDDDAQLHLRIAFLARSSAASRLPARLVANEMLDLRLAAIREELAASYGVYASYDVTGAGDLVEIRGDIDPSRAADVLARVAAELTDLHDRGGELKADFVRARRVALRRALAQIGSADSMAEEAEGIVESGLPLDFFVRMAAQVAAVTPADTAALLHDDLDPAREVVVVTGPGAHAAAAAAKLGAITDLPKAAKSAKASKPATKK